MGKQYKKIICKMKGRNYIVQTRACSKTQVHNVHFDENELEGNLRLEKVVATKLRLAVETEEDRRAKLENQSTTKWLRLAKTDKERKARLEKMVATTRLRLVLEREEERREIKRNLIFFKE